MKKISFEEALDNLDEIVTKLENGEITLDESLNMYKKGKELSKVCKDKLDKAEKDVKVLEDDLTLKEYKEEN